MPIQTLPFCPKCKSVDVERDSSVKTVYRHPGYICKNCGHFGQQFPEVDVKELGVEPKKESKLFWTTWKIIGPLLIFLGIFLFTETFFWAIFLLGLGSFMTYTVYKKSLKK